mmetsp:Transcript_11449/g.23235  ORF Transcript_11449/g.23235 Transcript_11449/m.23235 type:complete len:95 (+) Transcript_11449:584-868(+)
MDRFEGLWTPNKEMQKRKRLVLLLQWNPTGILPGLPRMKERDQALHEIPVMAGLEGPKKGGKDENEHYPPHAPSTSYTIEPTARSQSMTDGGTK